MTSDNRIMQLLEESGALMKGHFILSSGLHSDRYCQIAKLYENPAIGEQVAKLMVEKLPADLQVDVVLAPALGAILFGYELARALGVRSVFAERPSGEGFQLRRDFEIGKGERVLVAENVVTTGKSVLEMLPLVQAAEAHIVGFATVADRSKGAFQPGPPVFSLVDLNFEVYPPDSLPEHLRKVPAIKPGSRAMPTAK